VTQITLKPFGVAQLVPNGQGVAIRVLQATPKMVGFFFPAIYYYYLKRNTKVIISFQSFPLEKNKNY
jgi:hypothetical protein